jgi:hypothetical protein
MWVIKRKLFIFIIDFKSYDSIIHIIHTSSPHFQYFLDAWGFRGERLASRLAVTQCDGDERFVPNGTRRLPRPDTTPLGALCPGVAGVSPGGGQSPNRWRLPDGGGGFNATQT